MVGITLQGGGNTLPCIQYKGVIAFKIITEKEFTETSWWFSDGTQPISNGQACYVINKDHDPRVFISCCANCGDYAVYDMVDMTLEMQDKLEELKGKDM